MSRLIINDMTPEQFALYLKKTKDRVINFDKYRTEQRRNGPIIGSKTLKRSMKRRGFK